MQFTGSRSTATPIRLVQYYFSMMPVIQQPDASIHPRLNLIHITEFYPCWHHTRPPRSRFCGIWIPCDTPTSRVSFSDGVPIRTVSWSQDSQRCHTDNLRCHTRLGNSNEWEWRGGIANRFSVQVSGTLIYIYISRVGRTSSYSSDWDCSRYRRYHSTLEQKRYVIPWQVLGIGDDVANVLKLHLCDVRCWKTAIG